MRYVYTTFKTTSSGLLQDLILRINSLYDPEYAAGGHQPFGRDNMASLYNKYRVFGMKYRITFWNTDSSVPLLVAVVPTNSYSSDTVMNTIMERGYAKHRVIPCLSAGGLGVIKGYASMAKVHGVKKSVVKNDDTFAAFASAEPSREAFLHIYVAPIDAASAITVRINVECTYMCQWFDRIAISGS